MARPLAALAAILVIYAVLLGRATTFGFVWDDVHEIANNAAFERPLVEGLFATQTERTDPALTELSTIELAYDSYRPAVFASLWIDVQLWGRSPRALHTTSVLLGAITVLLAYALARRWLGNTWALLPAATVALHPMQIEAVAYISARADLLAGIFALLAIYASLRASDANGRPRAILWLVTATFAFACSLLSKESYVGLPLVVLAALLGEGAARRRWWIPAILGGVLAGYFLLRAAVVTSTSGQALASGLIDLPGVWLEYIRVVALPFDLSTERLRQPALVLPGAFLCALVVIGSLVAVRRGSLAGELRTALLGFVWMAVLVAPASVAIHSNGVVADRYFYISLFGVALTIAASARLLTRRYPRLIRPLAVAGALLLALWLLVAWRQVPVWESNRTLYTHAVVMTPESSMAQYRLGYLEALDGDWNEAIAHLEKAVARDSNNVLALNNLGVGYLRTGQLAHAQDVLSRAVHVNPAHFRAWFNLGLAIWERGDHERGCAAIARALAINPRYGAAAIEHARRCGHHSRSGPDRGR